MARSLGQGEQGLQTVQLLYSSKKCLRVWWTWCDGSLPLAGFSAVQAGQGERTRIIICLGQIGAESTLATQCVG